MDLKHYYKTTPPRCLAGFRPVAVRPRKADAAWRLRCTCGSEEGAILGHPLGALKPGFEESELMVSPFFFRCAGCERVTSVIDTAEHGEGSEFARLEGRGDGCAAYRGEGEPEPAVCPNCGAARAAAVVRLTYHDDRIADFEADPSFPLADYFDWFRLSCECSVCGREWEVSVIDTKP